MNLGVWDGRPPVVEAKTASETVVVSDENGNGTAPSWRIASQDASVPRTRSKLDWQTDKKSDCQVEITAIRRAGDKEYAHKVYKVGSRLRALATDNGKQKHMVMLDDLAPGVTVVFRIHATRLEGNGRERQSSRGLHRPHDRVAEVQRQHPAHDVALNAQRQGQSEPNDSPRTARSGTRGSRQLSRRHIACQRKRNESEVWKPSTVPSPETSSTLCGRHDVCRRSPHIFRRSEQVWGSYFMEIRDN